MRTLSVRRWLMGLAGLLLLADASIFLGIPYLRPVLVVASFSIVPGVLLLHVIRLDKAPFVQKLVVSIGLSLAFLIFGGLAINVILPLLGIGRPLSPIPLLVSFNLLLAPLFILAYLGNRGGRIVVPQFTAPGEKPLFSPMLFSVLFPLLGVIGVNLMNRYGNNAVLLANYLLIPAYVLLLIVLRKRIPASTYPVAVAMIAIALLLQKAMTSNYLIGGDVYSEYHVFNMAVTNQRWDPSNPLATGLATYSSLSLTLLLPVLQSLSALDGMGIFKLVAPLLISVVPLAAYGLYERRLGPFYAFLASLYIVAQLPFMYLLTGQLRVGLALIFFILAFAVLLDRDLEEFPRRLLFMIFGLSMVVSYYVTPVLFFFILLVLAATRVVFRAFGSKAPPLVDVPAALFGVAIFIWWSQMTVFTFPAYVRFFQQIVEHMGAAFTGEFRGMVVTRMYNFSGITLPDKFVAILNDITFLLVGAGTALAFLLRSQREKYGLDFLLVMFSGLFLLAAVLVLPYASVGYGADRFYLQMVLLVAPAFVIGTDLLIRAVHRRLPLVIMGLLLAGLFFCNSYLVYHFLGFPKSEIYDSASYNRRYLYVYDGEVAAANWLDRNNSDNLIVYMGSEIQASNVFEFGYHALDRTFQFRPFVARAVDLPAFVLLRQANIVERQVFGIAYPGIPAGKPVPIENYSALYSPRGKVYANGAAEIYR